MSMPQGVKVRTPFLDCRLVNFAFSLRSESKLDRGYTKLILRGGMKGALLGSILACSKIGFSCPVADWFLEIWRYLSRFKLQAIAMLSHGRDGHPTRSPEWIPP
jgi:asparagine synthetase B (glutamine-hydrolysing)